MRDELGSVALEYLFTMRGCRLGGRMQAEVEDHGVAPGWLVRCHW